MPVALHSTLDTLPIETGPISAALERALSDHQQADAELTIIIVDDAEIQRLHRDFLGIDSPTDCLSFSGDDGELGEVYLSLDTATRQAASRGHDVSTEALLYAVHGTLHLLGYDDHDEADQARMRAAELRYAGLRGDA
ncbi:rRNA maturation RNase YbeY [bacterium AH-315-M10]|nr:rRNA maturation RNase YbeY [bacterium AH-315-M10]